MVLARRLAERMAVEKAGSGKHAVTVTEEHQEAFEALWAQEQHRHYWCNAKTLLTGLSRELVDAGFKQISARKLSQRMRADEIPEEMTRVLNRAEELLRQG